MTYYKTDIIQSCYKRTKDEGNKCFGVQSNNQCVTNVTACDTYNTYGASTGCVNGRGGRWMSDVYKIRGILIKFRSGPYALSDLQFPRYRTNC